jgi:hypothetical protein
MLTIGYIPVMIGVTLVFAVYNLLLVPLAYVKLWWHKLVIVYVYSKSYRVSRADKFITFCIFWGFGLLTLTLSAFADLYYFVRHLWLRDLLKTQHKSTHVQLSKRNIEKVRRYFLTQGDRIVSYKEAATQIREIVGVFDSILAILRPNTLSNFLTMKEQQEEDAPMQVDSNFARIAADDKNL